MSETKTETKARDWDLKTRSTNWIFTWNNYPADGPEIAKKWFEEHKAKCLMFEQEIAPSTGTPHLQGFIVFNTKKSGYQVVEIAKGIYWHPMDGSIEANKTYCSKDKTGVVILGELPLSKAEKGAKGGKYGHKGAEAGIEENVWLKITKEILAGTSYRQLAIMFPEEHGRYPKGFKEKFELLRPQPKFDLKERYGRLYEWQSELLEIIGKDPNARSVQWIWSKQGNVGKSDMLKHLVSCNGFQPMQNAPTRDLACAWKGSSVAFDYSRDEQHGGNINYAALEHIKNRLVFSPKYESVTKMSEDFKDVFVVCFSNQLPDISKLSPDRWEIYEIKDDPNKSWVKMDPAQIAREHSLASS